MKWYVLNARLIKGITSPTHTVLVSGVHHIPPESLTTLQNIIRCDYRVYIDSTSMTICAHAFTNRIYQRIFLPSKSPTTAQIMIEAERQILLHAI